MGTEIMQINWTLIGQSGKAYLLWEVLIGGRQDVGNERAILDVLIITNHMHRILARLRGPIANIARAIPLVVTLNLGL